MVGANQFSAMSIRAGGEEDNAPHSGNIGVIICGGFAQMRPIGRKTLIAPISAERSPVAAKLGNAGRRIFDAFSVCAKFRVIYRQVAPCPFKASTRRLLDCAVTLSDYDLWQSRDIASDKFPEDLKERAGNFIWLCDENAATGDRNGENCPLTIKKSNPRHPAIQPYVIRRPHRATSLANLRASPPISTLLLARLYF